MQTLTLYPTSGENIGDGDEWQNVSNIVGEPNTLRASVLSTWGTKWFAARYDLSALPEGATILALILGVIGYATPPPSGGLPGNVYLSYLNDSVPVDEIAPDSWKIGSPDGSVERRIEDDVPDVAALKADGFGVAVKAIPDAPEYTFLVNAMPLTVEYEEEENGGEDPPDPPMPVTVKPTAAEIIAEGQIQTGWFPNCANQSAVNAFIESRIDDVDSEVRLKVGAYYTSSDDNILTLLHKAEIYLVLGRLWQIVKNTMDGYDAEALPPEFVEPPEAAANRDYYLEEGKAIIDRYDVTGEAVARPYFNTRGVSVDDE